MARSTKLMSYYQSLESQHYRLKVNKSVRCEHLGLNSVRLVAADLGLKHTLFSEKLVADLVWNAVSGAIILTLLYLYSQSLVLTLVALGANVLSLASAYTLYKLVFGIEFFPFLNLLTLAILIGIGCDNLLIYCKAWSCCVQELAQHDHAGGSFYSSNRKIHKHARQKSLDRAFRHVFISALCASLTTCCAFFVGFFAQITSLKCFAFVFRKICLIHLTICIV